MQDLLPSFLLYVAQGSAALGDTAGAAILRCTGVASFASPFSHQGRATIFELA